ncbi:hypothetical protein ASD79_17170 [Caulobacter sp. Root655]|uniref:alpha/beta fold hydrolase n=1 Tax=Caulobacter sp. Root655 TaxID=1736578 RepID=UPI0007023C1C|nr:alpha/beta fold hydrolase [Caulobacter sp. Root655]KRA56790.1 hypothetical protein ASD79_17170 [Caulobacter sp. Root655]
MATFVLVHGAWHGSWCWQRVRRTLRELGHEVFTPTLSGVGERAHLLSPGIDLTVHIQDVANLIRWEELSDVVLCGHSYAGLVISGVAEQMPERIAALVYLDAFLPESGQSLHDTLPPEISDHQRAMARDHGGGWKVPPNPAAMFAVNDQDRDWVDRQCTPQSLATFEQPLIFSEKAGSIPDIRYVLATGWSHSPFAAFRDLAAKRGWRTSTMACGHDVMLDLPAELAAVLDGVAAG